jgi:di/tricarboxylate transporter
MVALILIILAFIFTQIMSGQVAALVLAPVAITVASHLHLDARALGMAVALGCSLSFPTPFGHPVNVLVMTPGGYTFRDYFRVGMPLTLLAIVFILTGLHLFWGI